MVIDPIFYLGGIDTLRGYNYEELVGTRIGTPQLRGPYSLHRCASFRMARPMDDWGIRGIAFADFGRGLVGLAIWTGESFPDILFGIKIVFTLGMLKPQSGLGLRLQLGVFSVDFAAAWHTDLTSIEPGMKYHLGLGQAF